MSTEPERLVEMHDTKAFALVSHDGRLYYVSAFTGRCKDFVPVVIVPAERHAAVLADVERLKHELSVCREVLRLTREQLREAGLR